MLALELLWGMESRLYNVKPKTLSRILRPDGFIVIEPKSLQKGEGLESRPVYLVRHCCLDTLRVGQILMKELEASSFSYFGLKDRSATVYQYYSFRAPRREPKHLVLVNGKIEAWLIGHFQEIRRGAHFGNIFVLRVESSDPLTLCELFKSTEFIPGYFGPQRFGILRPNTHVLGMHLIMGNLGDVLREFRFRYPLEPKEGLGYYEGRVISLLKRKGSLNVVEGSLARSIKRIFYEGLQAYIFNRALSQVLKSNSITSYAEASSSIRCLSRQFKVPVVRLPAPGMRMRSRWAQLLKRIIEEESILDVITRRDLSLRPVIRPMVYPLCKIQCKILDQTHAIMKFALPPGAYATVALWQISEVDWVSEELLAR